MQCGACQHQNSEQARFCESCGLRLARPCRGCGAETVASARFCSQCGQPTDPATLPPDVATTQAGERRQLTVMFCDLVGSTALGQRLDPEELRDVLSAYHDTCAVAAKRFEGLVAQYLGDGVLIYFGFPLAHEDDAERAIRSALEIQDSIARSNRRRTSTDAPEIAARIGIHTGLVVVGEIGDDVSHQTLALGETTNVASRLEGLAEPGGIVISENTLSLVSGRFITREIGTPALKGIVEPICVYAIEGLGIGRQLCSVQPSTPLVGRQLELAPATGTGLLVASLQITRYRT